MEKRHYRFYGGLLSAQEHWLNKMSEKGYRLIESKKLLYRFEKCKPGQFQYRIEFIGEKSKTNAENYRNFLEEMGYKVFYKNINLNYSVGKIRCRPWADRNGPIATNATTYNRELLIIENERDDMPFELHTSFKDKETYYKSLCKPWLSLFLLCSMLNIINLSLAFCAISLTALIPPLLYLAEIFKLKQDAKIKEW